MYSLDISRVEGLETLTLLNTKIHELPYINESNLVKTTIIDSRITNYYLKAKLKGILDIKNSVIKNNRQRTRVHRKFSYG
jgi:hypothetical protein